MNLSANQQQKIEKLFLFIKDNGFHHTMEEIASGINVTPKTLFNRYQNKENMEQQVQDYWCNKFWKRFQKKQEFCNNAIEELVLLTFELSQSHDEELHFFNREFKIDKMLKEGISPTFSEHTNAIINAGIEKGFFHNLPDPNQYTDYFLFNICTLFTHRNCKPDLLRYIFVSLLTDYGKAIFSEINLDSLVGQE